MNAISINKAENSLLVLGTQAGYDDVREIAQRLDYTPQEARLRLTFVTTDKRDLDAAGISIGPIPAFEPASARSLQAFLKKHPGAVTYPSVIVTDSVPVTIYLEGFAQNMDDIGAISAASTEQILARVNGDATVTISASGPLLIPIRTVPDGETATLPFASIGRRGRTMLIVVVTPTILSGRTANWGTSP